MVVDSLPGMCQHARHIIVSYSRPSPLFSSVALASFGLTPVSQATPVPFDLAHFSLVHCQRRVFDGRHQQGVSEQPARHEERHDADDEADADSQCYPQVYAVCFVRR